MNLCLCYFVVWQLWHYIMQHLVRQQQNIEMYTLSLSLSLVVLIAWIICLSNLSEPGFWGYKSTNSFCQGIFVHSKQLSAFSTIANVSYPVCKKIRLSNFRFHAITTRTNDDFIRMFLMLDARNVQMLIWQMHRGRNSKQLDKCMK